MIKFHMGQSMSRQRPLPFAMSLWVWTLKSLLCHMIGGRVTTHIAYKKAPTGQDNNSNNTIQMWSLLISYEYNTRNSKAILILNDNKQIKTQMIQTFVQYTGLNFTSSHYRQTESIAMCWLRLIILDERFLENILELKIFGHSKTWQKQ